MLTAIQPENIFKPQLSGKVMLKNFEPRLYQQMILATAASRNTLVVLPTGLGKTALAFLLAVQRLSFYPNSKILMLAPTKPLCEQHVDSFRKHLEISPEKVVLFTGSVRPEVRENLWRDAQVIISTPQGLENDVINKRIRLEEVSLLIFDEAHHATGDYSYVWLAQHYEKVSRFSRILALTASPGSDLEKVREVCKNLLIEKVEVRTEDDPDVKLYVQPVKIDWLTVDFPKEYQEIQKKLKDCRKSKLLEMITHGLLNNSDLVKGEMLKLQGELQKKISSGDRSFEVLKSISLLAEALKVEHALELLETQGLVQLQLYLKRIQQESSTSKVKAVKNLVHDENFKSALYLADDAIAKEVENPKLIRLRDIIKKVIDQDSSAKIIIFTQFRDSAEHIVKNIDSLGIKNHIFVGQAKKNGLGFTQKQQKEILDKFRNNDFNVLVATSVAEEGLDIPKVDKVIFYEPIPSAIRAIQRRGRTGRLEKGEVTILVTSKTRDEAYRWSSHHKEKRMYRTLETLKKDLSLSKNNVDNDQLNNLKYNNQSNKTILHDFIPKEQVVAVLADHREKDNKIIKELLEMNVSVKTAQLDSADYILSGKVGVELKKVPDFVASIIDGRLLEQVKDLKKNFEKSVLVIEGEEDIYSIRKVHSHAIKGMLSAIVLDFGVPVLYTKNPQDTAQLLAVMAKREQDKGRNISLNERKPQEIDRQLEFIVSSIPGIGLMQARKLLEKFGSVKKIINSSKNELVDVEKVGGKTADKLLKLFDEEYRKG